MKATRTLHRGLAILEALAASDKPLGPTRVAEMVELDKATAGRLLRTLCVAGYARQTEHGAYELTTKILQVANGVTLEPELRERARRHLMALRDATEETVHLAIREEDHVVYIDKIEAPHPVRLVSAIGQRMPLHTTALGKAALTWMSEEEREKLLPRLDLVPRTSHSITRLSDLRAELDRTRARGYSIDDHENEEHAGGVGAPILAAGGQVVGMVSVAGPISRVRGKVEELGRHCRKTAEAISQDLTDGMFGAHDA